MPSYLYYRIFIINQTNSKSKPPSQQNAEDGGFLFVQIIICRTPVTMMFFAKITSAPMSREDLLGKEAQLCEQTTRISVQFSRTLSFVLSCGR